MKLKNGVIITGLHSKMQIANAKAAVIWSRNKQELVITEGVCYRKEGGFHPLGRACDYRIRYFPTSLWSQIRQELQDELGNDYDVILEVKKRHIHVEYDVDNPKII